MVVLIQMNGGIFELLFFVCFGSDTHELLAGIFFVKRLGMCGDISMLELLRQRHLLELQLVDAAIRQAGKRRCGKEETALHV